MAHYDHKRESRIEMDASDGVVAAIYSQLEENKSWHPVAFFSKTIAAAEINYEVQDKNILAII